MATSDFQTLQSAVNRDATNVIAEDVLQALISNHPAVTAFRKRPSCTESRHVLQINEDDKPYSLTHTTITGPDMISEEPYVFTDDETGSIIAIFKLGSKLAGHTKIVHGGLPAVLLDECMGRACFPRLAGKIAVTAKLDLEYKSPIPVNSFIVIRADTTEVQGRKAWVTASVEDAQDGRLLVKAKALFIEPKWAGEMSQVV